MKSSSMRVLLVLGLLLAAPLPGYCLWNDLQMFHFGTQSLGMSVVTGSPALLPATIPRGLAADKDAVRLYDQLRTHQAAIVKRVSRHGHSAAGNRVIVLDDELALAVAQQLDTFTKLNGKLLTGMARLATERKEKNAARTPAEDDPQAVEEAAFLAVFQEEWTKLASAVHTFGFTTPYEPFTPERGAFGVAAGYNYWPLNHDSRRHLDGAEDWRTGLFELVLSYAPAADLSLSLALPVVAPNDPSTERPDLHRQSGVGDVTLRADYRLPSTGSMHTGLAAYTRLGTGSARKDTGLDRTFVGFALRSSYELWASTVEPPPARPITPPHPERARLPDRTVRLYASLGHEFDLGKDLNYGSSEFVVGCLGNFGLARKGNASPTGHAIGVWGEIAGTVNDDEVVHGGMKSMWELRAGVGYVFQVEHDERPTRYTVGLGCQRLLSRDALWSGPMSFTLTGSLLY